jgi:hypothetical protein
MDICLRHGGAAGFWESLKNPDWQPVENPMQMWRCWPGTGEEPAAMCGRMVSGMIEIKILKMWNAVVMEPGPVKWGHMLPPVEQMLVLVVAWTGSEQLPPLLPPVLFLVLVHVFNKIWRDDCRVFVPVSSSSSPHPLLDLDPGDLLMVMLFQMAALVDISLNPTSKGLVGTLRERPTGRPAMWSNPTWWQQIMARGR